MRRIELAIPESFTFPSSYGNVIIRRSQSEGGKWDLLINQKIVLRAAYIDPWEAADQIARADFGDEALNLRYAGIRVSSDLGMWKHTLGSTYHPSTHFN